MITGNPPYSYLSRNNGAFITQAIDDYRYTLDHPEGTQIKPDTSVLERQPLGERNPRALQDDYVKFVRFAQIKMDAVEEGVVGVITNHSWLDNATLRGMRQSLMRSFEQIYVLDLHGNAKKRERSPDGSKDENVFDIEQGVAISVFVKRPGLERGIWRGDLWGKRLAKYEVVATSSLKDLRLSAVRSSRPDYLFVVRDAEREIEYDRGWSLSQVFAMKSVGIVTARDAFTLGRTAEEIWDRIQDVIKSNADDVRSMFKLGKDTRDWTVAGAIADLSAEPLSRYRLKSVHYRPFDFRYTYVTGRSRGFLSYPRMSMWNQLGGRNLALISSRFTKGESFAHALVTDTMIEKIILSPNTSNNGFLFPLLQSPEGESENFSGHFRAFIDSRYEHHYAPEEIFGYIYAVLHAPTYRARYAEFLRSDFPRLPFPEKAEDFETLSGLGWALVQAHLLRELPLRGLAAHHGKGDHRVEAVRYSAEEQAIHINKSQCFKPVPSEVWDFHIGGYRVLDKYLNSRKGRVLSLDEINHLGAVADSLAFTIEQMARIDAVYRGAFKTVGKSNSAVASTGY